ncbi:testis-specific serine/threonine-protein kinase 1-like [Drosophila nasuta]|uniref:Testis-specific serine/threonine-protein kinase 1-like n=1 Tax=Drosophila albomicans TaxID=7291 RepID=A0A6P8XS69_DROAB|nr:testis-specific serine/threonine-protein kinase 1-like [Drosophila albomicans]XP_060645952.1 testis-specific serine/threonine-protein kinase 1-like [Drosophila nasuta]
MGSTTNNSQLQSRSSDVEALSLQGYKLGHKIGEGSYATVITAQYCNEAGNRADLACKVIDKAKAPTDFVNKFFPRELEILTKLDHPNIIQIHSILQRGLKIFIFMRYAEKGDLLSHIKKTGFIKEKQSKVWFTQMAVALKYLHNHDIAHRDMKCENILLSEHSNVKLADFGFACFCSNGEGMRLASQTYCGSAAYAAPEVVSGVPYDAQMADAWSLGVILFIMLNGKMPFDDSNLSKLLEDQRCMRFAFRRKLHDVITPQAKAAVAVLLEPNPATRWDMHEILNCSWLLMDKKNEK